MKETSVITYELLAKYSNCREIKREVNILFEVLIELCEIIFDVFSVEKFYY